MRPLLFVYGTLHPDRAPTAIADVVAQFTEVGHGRVQGNLYDLGAFPGAVLNPYGFDVPGTVFSVPEDAWQRLDAYEGFEAEAPQESLFLRTETQVVMEDETKQICWMYVWNRKAE